jgi:hypothetical protein
MAGQRLTDKTALDHLGTGDLLMVVDASDTTGSSSGTSKKMDSKYVIMTDKISVSNAELVALDDGGGAGEFKDIVSAPGSGYFVLPLHTTIIATGAGATEISNKSIYVGYDATQTTRYWTYWSRLASGIAAGDVWVFQQATPLSSASGVSAVTIDDLPLRLWSNGTFVGGWSFDLYITYKIEKIW